MTHTPSLGVYTDRQFLDELYRRVHVKRLAVELLRTGDGFAQLEISAGKGEDRYAFEALAYYKPVQSINVAPV